MEKEKGKEVIEVEVLEEYHNTKNTSKRKRKLTLAVWNFFEMLPLSANNKQRCKCKNCGTTYIAKSKYGTGNMKRNIDACIRRDTCDLRQLFSSQSGGGSMSIHANKFNQEKIHELLVMAITMHDLPFQFVEYEGIREIFTYLCG